MSIKSSHNTSFPSGTGITHADTYLALNSLFSWDSLTCLRCSCWQANNDRYDLYQMELLFFLENMFSTLLQSARAVYEFSSVKFPWAVWVAWQIEPYATLGSSFYANFHGVFYGCVNAIWYMKFFFVSTPLVSSFILMGPGVCLVECWC